jgi:hypothetical protein
MHHWLLFKRWEAATVPKTNLSEDEKEVLEMLNEPIDGLTRTSRMNEIEGESFGNLLKAVRG